MDILDVLREAPRLMDHLLGGPLQALASTCKPLRQWFIRRVTTATSINVKDAAVLQPECWPNLLLSITTRDNKGLTAYVARSYLQRSRWTSQLILTLSSLNGNIEAMVTAPKFALDKPTAQYGWAIQAFLTKYSPTTLSIKLQGELVYSEMVKSFSQIYWPVLTRLDMAAPRLESMPYDWRGFCPKLTELHIFTTAGGLGGTYMSHLGEGHGSCLKHLCLGSSTLSVADVKGLSTADCPFLQQLTLTSKEFDSTALQYLACGKWQDLRSLTLNHVQIDAAAARHLMSGNWPLLNCLRATHGCVQEAALEVLGIQDTQRQIKRMQPNSKSGVSTWFFLSRVPDQAWPCLHNVTVVRSWHLGRLITCHSIKYRAAGLCEPKTLCS